MNASFPRPTRIFLALCLASALLVGAYAFYVKQRAGGTSAEMIPPSSAAPLPPPATLIEPAPPSAPATAPQSHDAGETHAGVHAAPVAQRIFFRHTGLDAHYGKVGWSDTVRTQAVHFIETLDCEVVYVAGDHGICLRADRGVFTTYAGTLFDARTFAVSGTFPLKGIPSRARVSIDGSLAALTVFVSGHGYSTLDFSTQTLLVDTKSATALVDLEEFEVRRHGAVLKAADFNFWGVTFTPDARQFYATLSTAGKHFLVHGDIASRRAQIIHENVECPSLSPDARHVAYKKRLVIDNRILWQLQVLELTSGREIVLSERRSIDDQLEWLDNRHVLYSVPSADDNSSPSTNVWIASVDPASAPRLFLKNAYSPAVVRCKDPAACAQ